MNGALGEFAWMCLRRFLQNLEIDKNFDVCKAAEFQPSSSGQFFFVVSIDVVVNFTFQQ